MAVYRDDAISIAWFEFLYAVGEPETSRFEVGFCAAHMSETSTGRSTDTDEHWQIIFIDSRAWARSRAHSDVARVWVDKRTGHCNVWVNEDYDPRLP